MAVENPAANKDTSLKQLQKSLNNQNIINRHTACNRCSRYA